MSDSALQAPPAETKSDIPDRKSLELQALKGYADDKPSVTRDWTATDGRDEELDPATLMKGDKPKPKKDPEPRDEGDDKGADEADTKKSDSDKKSELSDSGQDDAKKKDEFKIDPEKDPDILKARLSSTQKEFHKRSTENAELKKSIASLKEELEKLKSAKSEPQKDQAIDLDKYELTEAEREYIEDLMDDPEAKGIVEKLLSKAGPSKKEEPAKKEEQKKEEPESIHTREAFIEVMDAYREDWRDIVRSNEFDEYTKGHKATVDKLLEGLEENDPTGLIKIIKHFDHYVSQNRGKKQSGKASDRLPDGQKRTTPASSGGSTLSRRQLEQMALKGLK